VELRMDKDVEDLKKELNKDEAKDDQKEVQGADDYDDEDGASEEVELDYEDQEDDEDEEAAADKKEKDQAEGEANPEVDEERQRRRERRKRDKERKKARDRELRLRLDQERSEKEELAQRLARLEERHVSSDIDNIEREINRGIKAMETAKAAMAKAEEEKDSMTWAKAQALHREAQDHVRRQASLKEHVIEAIKTRQSGGAMTVTPQIKAYSSAFLRKNGDWFDQQNQGLKRAVLEIDNAVMSEGFNPNTAAYWKELEARCRTIFNRPKKKQQRTTVGGASTQGSMRDTEPGLDATFVKLLKEQGLWDKPDMRKKAIENYKKQRKQ